MDVKVDVLFQTGKWLIVNASIQQKNIYHPTKFGYLYIYIIYSIWWSVCYVYKQIKHSLIFFPNAFELINHYAQ